LVQSEIILHDTIPPFSPKLVKVIFTGVVSKKSG